MTDTEEGGDGRNPFTRSIDPRVLLAIFLIAIFAFELLRTAWMSDDSYITLRTVDNLVVGYGARWNTDERVQAFTHPLWMLLLAAPYAATREAYFTPLVLSIALSIATVWIFATRVAASWQMALVGGTSLIFSNAFVDYSTSGLENPLTHFLLAVLMLLSAGARGSRLTAVWLVAGLAMVNRVDLGLLVLPAAVSLSRGNPWRRVASAATLGLLPILLWEIFSVVYYGFPFPNTAYAKLQTGVSQNALVTQGLWYFRDSMTNDPVTLASTLLFSVLALACRPRAAWPWVLGIAFYMLYITWIGGDFMSGRFFSAALLCAVALFARVDWRLPWGAVAVIPGLVASLALFAATRGPMTTTFGPSWEDSDHGHGISDERAFYYRYSGLLEWTRERPLPYKSEGEQGKKLRATGSPELISHSNVGFLGYFAGPQVHIIDRYALAEPLLARLPAQPNWRIGHYYRELPEGYFQTLQTGQNLIADARVATLYERLKLITRGPLFSRRRWRAIYRMNVDGANLS